MFHQNSVVNFSRFPQRNWWTGEAVPSWALRPFAPRWRAPLPWPSPSLRLRMLKLEWNAGSRPVAIASFISFPSQKIMSQFIQDILFPILEEKLNWEPNLKVISESSSICHPFCPATCDQVLALPNSVLPLCSSALARNPELNFEYFDKI